MAIILPLLVLLLAGVVSFGILIREHQILQNAAREGARLSSLRPMPAVDVQNRVVAYLAQENITISASDVTVNQDYLIPMGGSPPQSARGSMVTVSYSRPMLIGGSLFPWTPTLTGVAVFRNLY